MAADDILKELTMDDLQEQHRAIAETIGFDTLIRLSQSCGGTQIYIPMLFELTKDFTYRKILEEFTGDNIQQLAITQCRQLSAERPCNDQKTSYL